MLSRRDDELRKGGAFSRKSRRNRLIWTGAAESMRLEPRTMLSLTVKTFPISLVGLIQPQGITTGPDGNLWFAETAANKIGRMIPAGALTRVSSAACQNQPGRIETSHSGGIQREPWRVPVSPSLART